MIKHTRTRRAMTTATLTCRRAVCLRMELLHCRTPHEKGHCLSSTRTDTAMRLFLCVCLIGMCSDEKDGVWVWNFNGNDMYYDLNTKVRLRVREVVFQNQDDAALQRRKHCDALEHDVCIPCNSTIAVSAEQTTADGQPARPHENGTAAGRMDYDGTNRMHDKKADDACTSFGGYSNSFLVGVSANFAPMMVVVRIHTNVYMPFTSRAIISTMHS